MKRERRLIGWAATWTVVGASVLGAASNVDADDAVRTARLEYPRRSHPERVEIDPATRRIVVIGDSILFTRLKPGQRQNMIVPLAERALRDRVPGVEVHNRSMPGLSTLHTIDSSARPLRPYLLEVLGAAGAPPDLVVIAISSIDINLFPDVSVARLAPALISELRSIERLLADRGVQTVFVPVFGINGHMYNALRALFEPFRDYRFNERVAKYNELLRASGLPLLFDRFGSLDRDGDGHADRRYFVGNDPLAQWPDDGIHPNALGERLFGDFLADGLVAAFERGR